MKYLFIIILFSLQISAQENPYAEIDQIYCSNDSLDWHLVMNNETGYIATGDDLRIASVINLTTMSTDGKLLLSTTYEMLIIVLGSDRARAIGTIYFSKYYKAIKDNGEIVMQGYGSSYLRDGYYIEN